MFWMANLQKLWPRALGIGILNAVLLSAIMVPVFLLGFSPFPQPPSLAFAQTVLGRPLPLPVGLLFHVAYVTFWSLAYIVVSYPRMTLLRALSLAAALWIVILTVFFPIIGWGRLGLGIGPRLIIASFIPHLLFGLFLWALCRAILQ